jgi:hypothetical protein
VERHDCDGRKFLRDMNRRFFKTLRLRLNQQELKLRSERVGGGVHCLYGVPTTKPGKEGMTGATAVSRHGLDLLVAKEAKTSFPTCNSRDQLPNCHQPHRFHQDPDRFASS